METSIIANLNAFRQSLKLSSEELIDELIIFCKTPQVHRVFKLHQTGIALLVKAKSISLLSDDRMRPFGAMVYMHELFHAYVPLEVDYASLLTSYESRLDLLRQKLKLMNQSGLIYLTNGLTPKQMVENDIVGLEAAIHRAKCKLNPNKQN
jgi:hypothetical protein